MTEMYCYCANYYSAVNCHNVVGRFGDRCKLCKALNEGRSFRYDFVYPIPEYDYDSEAVADESGRTSRDERHPSIVERGHGGGGGDHREVVLARREKRAMAAH